MRRHLVTFGMSTRLHRHQKQLNVIQKCYFHQPRRFVPLRGLMHLSLSRLPRLYLE